MPSAIELKGIRKSYEKLEIIKGIDLVVNPSEFVVLVGPSGCGKSTLLRMIAGLEEISSGELWFDDKKVNDWDPAKRRVGMVFQSYALYPHMSVEENIGFGLKLAKKPKAEIEKRVNDAINILQLDQYRKHKPSQLSGGQRQRVAIGRAIVRKPNVFLFDEPLSNLDASLRVQMRMEIGRLHQRLKNTVIYVTHDQVEAMTLADKIVVLEGGMVRQIGTPMDLYENPANKFVASFIGTPTMGFVNAKVTSKSNASTFVELHSDSRAKSISLKLRENNLEVGDIATIGIRPEDCKISDIESADIVGTVVMLERLGADTFAFAEVEGVSNTFPVRLSNKNDDVHPGDKVGIKFTHSRCHIFDRDENTINKLQ